LLVCKLNIVDLINFEEYLQVKSQENLPNAEKLFILTHFEEDDKH
jgi:hypothetical protein